MELRIRYTVPKWLVVFIFALGARAVLNLVFSGKFGPHAAVEKEIWYYYGIINNNFEISRIDPTYWILQLVKLSPEIFWFNLIAFFSSLLSSLTAVLVYFFTRRLFDNVDLGFWAGIIYAFLAGPLGMSTASFTHDLVQLPIIILLFLTALSISRNNGLKRTFFITAFLILTYIGLHVGPLITIAVLISLLYLSIVTIKERNRLFAFCLIFLVILLIRLIFLNDILRILNHFSLSLRGINLLSQIKVHARDLAPIRIKSLLLRVGIWSILVFLGLGFNRKKIEPFSFLIFFIGIIFASAFARLVRIVDIGCVLLAASAFNFPWFRKTKFWIVSTFSILTLIFCCIYLRPKTTEAEYQSFVWLREHYQKQDRVLIGWPYGYFLKAVSGLEPTSSPQAIDFSLHKIYWGSLNDAYEILKERGIKFVYVSNRQFGITFIDPVTDEFKYSGDGSIIYRPEEAGINKFYQLEDTFLFNLMDDPAKLDDFQLIRESIDRGTSTHLRIYMLR